MIGAPLPPWIAYLLRGVLLAVAAFGSAFMGFMGALAVGLLAEQVLVASAVPDPASGSWAVFWVTLPITTGAALFWFHREGEQL